MSSFIHQDSCEFLRNIQIENLDYKPSYIKHWIHYNKFKYPLHNININNNLIKDDIFLYDNPDLPIIDKFDENLDKKISELKLERSHRHIYRFEKIYRDNEMSFDDYILVHLDTNINYMKKLILNPYYFLKYMDKNVYV